MRLMGTDKLHALATGEDPALALAARCLRYELSAARWTDASEAAADFPKAQFVGQRMQIPLPGGRLVVLAVDYRLGIVLVVSTGTGAQPVQKPIKPRRKA